MCVGVLRGGVVEFACFQSVIRVKLRWGSVLDICQCVLRNIFLCQNCVICGIDLVNCGKSWFYMQEISFFYIFVLWPMFNL